MTTGEFVRKCASEWEVAILRAARTGLGEISSVGGGAFPDPAGLAPPTMEVEARGRDGGLETLSLIMAEAKAMASSEDIVDSVGSVSIALEDFLFPIDLMMT